LQLVAITAELSDSRPVSGSLLAGSRRRPAAPPPPGSGVLIEVQLRNEIKSTAIHRCFWLVSRINVFHQPSCGGQSNCVCISVAACHQLSVTSPVVLNISLPTNLRRLRVEQDRSSDLLGLCFRSLLALLLVSRAEEWTGTVVLQSLSAKIGQLAEYYCSSDTDLFWASTLVAKDEQA